MPKTITEYREENRELRRQNKNHLTTFETNRKTIDALTIAHKDEEDAHETTKQRLYQADYELREEKRKHTQTLQGSVQNTQRFDQQMDELKHRVEHTNDMEIRCSKLEVVNSNLSNQIVMFEKQHETLLRTLDYIVKRAN